MVPELTRIGGEVYKWLETRPERIAVVVSADLAHTFREDGPYGYTPAAVPFDRAIGAWASELDQDALLVEAASLVDEALSCGYTGLVLLNGMLRAHAEHMGVQGSVCCFGLVRQVRSFMVCSPSHLQ